MNSKTSALKTSFTFRRIFPFIFLFIIVAGCKPLQVNDDYFFISPEGKSRYIAAYNKTLQLWKVPFKETDIQTDYGLAHVIISGLENGRPILLFNGMDASSTMWYPNITAFDKNYRVYGVDFPLEAGKSVACVRKMAPIEIVRFYEQVISGLKLKDVSLVAISGGGWAATLLASESKMKFRKLVLISPAQTFTPLDQQFKVLPALMLKLFPSRRKLEKTLKIFSLYPERIEKDYTNQFYMANKYWRKNIMLMQMMVPFPDPRLEKLDMPVLVAIGDHDVVNSEKTLNRAKALIKNVETIVIPDSGHFIINDQPEVINKKILEFLDKD